VATGKSGRPDAVLWAVAPAGARQWYKFAPADMKQSLAAYRAFAGKCLKSKKSMFILVAS
jgi:hypothetical protein